MNENYIVSLDKVRKSFSEGCIENEILRGVSLDVKKSEFVSIMGPSGCGKSTLLYLIGGLEPAKSGLITCCGKKLRGLSDSELSKLRLENIGFVFQFNNLVQNLTVEENILLPIILGGKKVKDYADRVDELLSLMGLTEKKKSFPSILSGGQQQRIALARAVIASPKLILADEPTGNLDYESGKAVLEILRKLNKDQGITIIMVTHSEEAASYADRTVRMKDGVILN